MQLSQEGWGGLQEMHFSVGVLKGLYNNLSFYYRFLKFKHFFFHTKMTFYHSGVVVLYYLKKKIKIVYYFNNFNF